VVADALEEAAQAAIDVQAVAPMTAVVPDDKPDRDDTCECRPYFFYTMVTRLRNTIAEYPSQFWLMVIGLFISSAGASMIWPFLMIFGSEKLSLSLSTVSTLITINAIMGLFASFIAGTVSDKLG
jgi:hypothetical protein